jgi:biopolymer transport protein ExbB/TolQ
MVNISNDNHHLFLMWLIAIGVISFLVILAFDEGYLFAAFKNDQSHITKMIASIFLLGSVHCGLRLKLLCVELELVDALEEKTFLLTCDVRKDIQNFATATKGIAANYLSKVSSYAASENNTATINSATEVLIAQAKKGHESGWFMVDLLIKLGLLGTIIGFILMLGTVSQADTLDIQMMQAVLKDMSGGMGTALYTTLLGLSTSVLLSGQYLLMDKCADSLIERLLNITGLISNK